MMDRQLFTQRILGNWAERYGCTVDALLKPGIVILSEPDYAGSGGIHAWHIGRHTFVRFDPALQSEIDALKTVLGSRDSLEPGQLTGALEAMELLIKDTDRGLLSYLYPPDFRHTSLPKGFTIRQLEPSDAQALAELQAACGANENDEAEVSVEDEIPFGCFYESRLATVATGFTLTGFMDIGVLTHPDFRKQGLGGAAVSTLSAWCLERDILPQYRCSETNTASHKLALKLGFETLIRSEHIHIELDTHVE
jgi:RimJ/RimL family protein N-acetyltransferase